MNATTQRIPLTIDTDYLPGWGATEGLRELVQNWLDASDVTGQRIDPVYERGAVTLSNPGAKLDRSVLLLGVTTKPGTTQRGQFGEGLKLGTLALVRSGHPVTVLTTTERWEARIAESDTFAGRKVLEWHVSPHASESVEVRIEGLDEKAWEAARELFRCFDSAEVAAHVDTYYGTILINRPGDVYVRGIRVCHDDTLRYGYDFSAANVDRDRKMVRAFDLGYHASHLVAAAMVAGHITPSDVLGIASAAAPDVAYLQHTSEPARRMVADAFKAAHGENAMPCASASDVQLCVNLDMLGMLLPEPLVSTLSPFTGTVSEAVEAARVNVVQRFAEDALTADEVDALTWARDHAALAFKVPPGSVWVHVVEYRDEKTLGMFRGGGCPVEVARRVLKDRIETLATLIHEVAHLVAGDGERAHTATVEQGWAALARHWTAA